MSAIATSPVVQTAPTGPATVLIVEDTPFWQKQIEQAVQAAGYATLFANNGAEALVICETHNPSLIVSDIEMPEMSGLELMKALRSKPQYQKLPVILLTTGTQKEMILEATRLHAAEYLLKGAFSAEQLGLRVKKWLNGSQIRPAAEPKKNVASAFPRLLEKGNAIAGFNAHVPTCMTFANVVKQATEACKPTQGNSSGLLEMIKNDPVFAMCALQQANKSKRVGTVDDAVRAIGVDGIRGIVETLKSYPTVSQNTLATWQHSIAVASIMHRIVPRSFEMGIGVAYLIGLLHDLPEILLRQAFPSQCEATLDFAGQAGRSFRNMMPDIVGASISEIAGELVTLLKLPPLIASPLREYAAASEVIGQSGVQSAPIVDRLALALRFAEYYTNALRLTALPSEAFIAPLTVAECRAAYVAADAIDGAEIREHAIAQSLKLAGDATPAAVVTRARPKLWYARHSSYAPLDPVEEALKLVADVQCHSEPPNKREHLASVDGVVVVAPSLETFGMLWCLPDRTSQGMTVRPKVLHVLPSSKSMDKKSSSREDTRILHHPFSLEMLNGIFKQFEW